MPNGDKPVRVLVADYQPIMRAGFRSALEAEGFRVCAEAGNPIITMEAAAREKPDVCLLDINLAVEGTNIISEIKSRAPGTAVVILASSTSEDAEVWDILSAGAVACLLRDMDPRRLPHILETVLEGYAAVPRSLLSNIKQERKKLGLPEPLTVWERDDAKLTPRESEVLGLLGEGLPTGEVAERLGVTPATVRSHVRSIVKKLQVDTRAAAILLTTRNVRQ